jgi:hypothetical protein
MRKMNGDTSALPTVTDGILGDHDRRAFLQRAMLALLAGPAAGSALLAGCNGTAGLDAGLAALLAQVRQAFGQLLNEAEGTNFPTRQQWNGWFAQFNQRGGQCHNAAVTASDPEIRSNYDPAVQQVTAWLNQQNIPPDFQGPPPAWTEQDLRLAWLRAQGLVAGLSLADRRALWAFILGLILLAAGASDQDIRDTADELRAEDTTDVGGRIYDAIFGVASTAGDAPANLANRTALFNLLPLLAVLLLVGLGAQAARNVGILVAAHPQVLFVLTVFLLFFFPS